MNFDGRKSSAVSILLILTVAGAIFFLHQPEYNYWPEPVEEPNVSATYYEENESLVFTVEDGSFTSKSGKVFFRDDLRADSANLSLTGYGKSRNTTVWAESSFLGLGDSDSGMTDFPIEEGESIAVKAQGTHLDQHGYTGLKSNTIYLKSEFRDVGAVVTHYFVLNGTAYRHGVMNTS